MMKFRPVKISSAGWRVAVCAAAAGLSALQPGTGAGAAEGRMLLMEHLKEPSKHFYASDGYSNGPNFGVFWKGDHVEFAADAMALRLDTEGCGGSSCGGKSYASGEYVSVERYGYGRFEGRIKAAKGAGLVTSLFLYSGPNPDGSNDEIDIEILGKDPTKVTLNYYTDGETGHSKVVNLGFDASKGYHTYAFEWTAARITWFVDGKKIHSEDGRRGRLPSHPGYLIANLWAGAGSSARNWTGTFVYPGRPVKAYYDWIRYSPL